MKRIKGILLPASVVAMAIASPAPADEQSDLIGAVEASGHTVPSARTLRASCDDDMMCIARFLVDMIGEGAALQPLETAASPRSSWLKTPAVGNVTEHAGRKVMPILRFDAETVTRALKDAPGGVVLDMRETADQDLDPMRRVAALFIGGVERAFTVSYFGGRRVDWTVPKPRGPVYGKPLEIWVGPKTGNVAALFAALLSRHGGARVLGPATQTDAFLSKDLAVVHGWSMRVPTAFIGMPDTDLSKGLVPSGPIPR